MGGSSYRDLAVWQKGLDMVVRCYMDYGCPRAGRGQPKIALRTDDSELRTGNCELGSGN